MREAKPAYLFIGGTSEPGGLHVHTAAIAEAVAGAGHPVSILSTSVDHFSGLLQGRIPVTAIPSQPAATIRLRDWRRLIAGAGHGRPVAVVCRGKLGEGAISDLAAIRLAARHVITVEHRDLDPGVALPAWHGPATRALVRRVVAVSPHIARSATAMLGFPPHRVSTCVNWVHPQFVAVDAVGRAAAKRRLGLAPETIVIGYHGRLAPEKRVDRFVAALAEILPDAAGVQAVIAGDGWKRAEIEALACARGIAGRITFTGWQADPLATIAAFDIAVLPSLHEGFPLGLMESMAIGAACLAHPMPATRALIASGNGVLADLADTAGFAAALRKMLALGGFARARMGEAAAATIAAEHSRQRRLPDVLRALGVSDIDAAMAAPSAPRQTLTFGA